MPFEVACSLCLVSAVGLVADVPLNISDVMSELFVNPEVDCLLRLVVAAVLVTAVPSNINIMDVCFVLFKGACKL